MIANSTLHIDFEREGQVITARARQLTTEELEALGQTTLTRTFGEDIVGVGQAKCRKDDCFDDEIGLNLSAARATEDFSRQYAEAVAAEAITKRQELADAINAQLLQGAQLFSELVDITNETHPEEAYENGELIVTGDAVREKFLKIAEAIQELAGK